MKRLLLDANCKVSKTFIEANNIGLIDIPYFVNDKVLHFAEYTTTDYLDVNENFFVIEEGQIDSNTVENYIQDILFNSKDDILYLCTIDDKSVNYAKIKEIIALFKDKYPQNFEVVYLPSNNLATKFVIERAFSILKTKDKIIDIRKEVEKFKNSYSSFVLLDDKNVISKHMQRPTMSLLYGTKPMYNAKIDGSFELVGREEGLTNGVNNMLEVITRFNKGKTIVLSYSKSAKHAELLEHKLHKQYGEKVKIETRFLEPMLITQFGLGAVVVSFEDFSKNN